MLGAYWLAELLAHDSPPLVLAAADWPRGTVHLMLGLLDIVQLSRSIDKRTSYYQSLRTPGATCGDWFLT